MHKALEIYDIVRLILDYLSSGDHLNVVLVCKSLLEPVLDVIWGDLDGGPTPLFRLWPEDAVLDPTLPHLSKSLPEMYDTLLSIHEWDRFVYHSKRVKRLTWIRPAPPIPGLVQQLTASLACPGSPPILLPNLQSLVLPDRLQDEVTCQILQHFVTSSLQHIHYNYSTYTYSPDDFIHLLQAKFILQSLLAVRPPLNSLAILSTPTPPTSSQHVLQVLDAFKYSLRSVHFSTVHDRQHVEAMGSLPNLREMRIEYYYPPEDGEDLFEDVPAHWFSALRVLRSVVRVVLQILSSVDSAPWMTELEIENWSMLLIPDAVQRLIELIGSSCPNLRKFTFRGIERYDMQSHELQVQPVSIMPLKKCSDLRHVTLRSDKALKPPTDEEYIELLEAWPHLRYILVGIVEAPRLRPGTIELLRRRCASGTLDEFKIGSQYVQY